MIRILEAVLRREDAKHNQRAWMVWMIGHLAQTPRKKYPRLRSLQVKSRKRRMKQSPEQMHMIMDQWSSVMGSKMKKIQDGR